MSSPKQKKSRGYKTPGSGRVKGVINKKTMGLLERAQACGCDPFDVLLMFSANDYVGLGYKTEDMISPEMRLNAAKEASKYLYSQRRAVEVSGPDGGAIETKSRHVEEFKELLETGLNERKRL